MKKVVHKAGNGNLNGLTDSIIPSHDKIITIYGNNGQYYVFKYDDIEDRTSYWKIKNSSKTLVVEK
jgi:hypothetical protein